MTIAEYCKDRNISRVTLYRKLRENSISPDALRDAHGQLTPEGLRTIASVTDMYHVTPSKRATHNTTPAVDNDTVIHLKHEIEILTIKLTAATDLNGHLTAEIAELRAANGKLMEDLKAAQDALVHEMSRSWWDRLTGKNKTIPVLPDPDHIG